VQPIDGVAGQHGEGLAVSVSRPVDELRLHASLLPGGQSGRLYSTAQAGAYRFILWRRQPLAIPESVGIATLPQSDTSRAAGPMK
jgi:hypothetical protein